MKNSIALRPLERDDLPFIHQLNNNPKIMRYWFEEPYEAYVELSDLYDKHIHDMSERRFIIKSEQAKLGLVELVEINYIHSRAELQIIIAPEHQGNGYCKEATKLAMNYGFATLNLHKLYLIVDETNQRALHIYKELGFKEEGVLKEEFFSEGKYCTAIRMYIFQ